MDKSFLYYFSLVAEIGLTIVFSTLIGLFAGMAFDKFLGTKGIFLIIFLIIGIIGGFYNAYKQILKK